MTKADFYDAVRSGVTDALGNGTVSEAPIADLEANDGSEANDAATGLVGSFYALGDALGTLADSGYGLASALYPQLPTVDLNPVYSFNLPIFGNITINWANVPGAALLRWVAVFMIWLTGVFMAIKIVRSGVA